MRLFGEFHSTLHFQNTQGRDGIGHDRGLGIFGQRQVGLRPAAHQPEQALPQRVVDFLKHLARNRARLGQRLAHADSLAALPRKDECPHVRSLMHPVVSSRLWRERP